MGKCKGEEWNKRSDEAIHSLGESGWWNVKIGFVPLWGGFLAE